MTPGSWEKISNALIQLQRRLKKELKAEIKKEISQEKTSVVGGSSILTNHDPSGARRKADIERVRIKAEQNRVAEAFKRLEKEEGASAHQASSSDVQPNASSTQHGHAEYLAECDICSRETSRNCSLCQRDFYCSQSCEDKRSGRHLFTCAKRPLTSADVLYRSIGEDRMPEEEDVCAGFGFNYFESFADKKKFFTRYLSDTGVDISHGF
ncbi:unnamed protein product [Aspergillus oryzae RIB40]|uniref:DNA, SC103 n=1 Tax=Aspergillus oryzae (strain ATCC 42149 / RIB 40) TaxID=510516 RepID=Q2TY60_ASPOR|nr:unnamed protein product [Aspergillus oryzae RIB40]BAE65813.1 unnamed protein product [Aspergillus oryzae RIB40]